VRFRSSSEYEEKGNALSHPDAFALPHGSGSASDTDIGLPSELPALWQLLLRRPLDLDIAGPEQPVSLDAKHA
jgi:hypothetical protein